MEELLKRARFSASMIWDPYLKFDTFYRIFQATGDEIDFNSCSAVAVNLPAEDRNDAFFMLADLTISRGNLGLASRARDGILNRTMGRAVERAIARADPTTARLSAKEKKKKEKKGSEKKDDKS
jgi:hypothetical protein